MDVLNTILNNIDEGILIIDPDGGIVFVSAVAVLIGEKISLKKPFQVGEKLQDTINPGRKDVVLDMISEVKLKKQPNRTFAEYTTKTGTKIYLEISYVPSLNEMGELSNILLVMRDITTQKVSEKKLTTRMSNINHLVEVANAIIIGVDTSCYITEWNQHCVKVTGFDQDEVYAQKLTEILLTEGERPLFDILMARVLNHETMTNHEIQVRTKAGKDVTFLLSATPRTTATGEVIGVMFVGQDVTELTGYRKSLEKKVEERTRELQRILYKEKAMVEMKNRFVSIASHEFRAPLSSIQHAANFIRHHKKISPEDLTERLDGIEKQVGHMTSLLDDVLTYGKNEAGKIQLIINKIKLLEFTNKIIEEVGHVTKHTHTIHPDFHQLPSEIATDEKLLRSILINLLTNAVKFSPEKRDVYLRMQGMALKLMITVRDEGIGIPETEIDKIFDPFIRGKAAANIQGTGLGLSIAKKGTELLGGTIHVESKPGEGTKFVVTIPENQP